MNICMLNNLFPPIPSGSSHFTWDLSRHLVKRGHHVVVITAHAVQDTPTDEVKDGVYIYRLPCIKLPPLEIAHNFKWFTYTFTPSNLHTVRRIIKDNKIEVLHLNGHIFDLALSALWASRRECLPLVLTIHLEITHSKPIYNSILHLADRIFVRNLLIRRCNAVVSPDSNDYEYVKRVYQRESEIVPYGIEYPLSFSTNGAEELIQRYSIGQRPTIISLGHVHNLRDRVDLIHAMPALLKQIPSAILLIVGQVYINEPVELVRKLRLQDNVVFTGSLPRDTALTLLQAGDVEAHWLNLGNGLGIACIEAMALGKPIVTVCREDLLGAPILESWKNFIQAPRGRPDEIAETFIKLLSDKSLRSQIGKAGQMVIRDHFTWDKVCERMEIIYQNVSEKSRYSRSVR